MGRQILMETQWISKIVLDDDGIHFVCDDGKRFMDCLIEYDEDEQMWVLKANDSHITHF